MGYYANCFLIVLIRVSWSYAFISVCRVCSSVCSCICVQNCECVCVCFVRKYPCESHVIAGRCALVQKSCSGLC